MQADPDADLDAVGAAQRSAAWACMARWIASAA